MKKFIKNKIKNIKKNISIIFKNKSKVIEELNMLRLKEHREEEKDKIIKQLIDDNNLLRTKNRLKTSDIRALTIRIQDLEEQIVK